MIEAMLD